MIAERIQIHVQGQVQGVGFRPHAYRIAQELELTGWVKNTAAGVLIEVQGKAVSQFMTRLQTDLPALARITDFASKKIFLHEGEKQFEILASEEGHNQTIISPDTSICQNCLTELFDPSSTYYRYPFINCTHCGPRLSITRELPYDRAKTSMEKFRLCETCERDYRDPCNRRYHAQPTACNQCGPALSLSINDIAKKIRQGEIIALKGLGGYQLICDAYNQESIKKLRDRKNRDAKPFALMVVNPISAKQIIELTEQEETMLVSAQRPIVLCRKKLSSLPDSIAPGLSHLGVMLPSTPLQYLLFNALGGDEDSCQWLSEFHESVLIVTSANAGGNPLVIDDAEAQTELASIADCIVSYNRQIVTRVDDSVMRIVNNAPMLIRRARGFVPTPIPLAHEIPVTLALGGHLKNTFCITRKDEAFVSQHIGSLSNKATIDFFHESLQYWQKFLAVKPERIAHDLHPDFYTTLFAESEEISRFAIQHHHAHLAAVAAEHHIIKPVLGLALDGYGYGADGTAWGGELFLLEKNKFTRLGSFYPLPQPGGEMAAREPWRMGASLLHHLHRPDEISTRFADYRDASLIYQLLDNRINCPVTSSCGRLFDAASALLGIETISQYEGHAAMRLESIVTDLQIIPDGWCIDENYFDMTPAIKFLLDVRDPVLGANLFHGTLIAGLAAWIKQVAFAKQLDTVLFSGGCFLNKILTEGLIDTLQKSKINVFLPRELPPNDGGISLGQAWIAGNINN